MGEDMEEITLHEGGNKKKECWEMGGREGGARLWWGWFSKLLQKHSIANHLN